MLSTCLSQTCRPSQSNAIRSLWIITLREEVLDPVHNFVATCSKRKGTKRRFAPPTTKERLREREIERTARQIFLCNLWLVASTRDILIEALPRRSEAHIFPHARLRSKCSPIRRARNASKLDRMSSFACKNPGLRGWPDIIHPGNLSFSFQEVGRGKEMAQSCCGFGRRVVGSSKEIGQFCGQANDVYLCLLLMLSLFETRSNTSSASRSSCVLKQDGSRDQGWLRSRY